MVVNLFSYSDSVFYVEQVDDNNCKSPRGRILAWFSEICLISFCIYFLSIFFVETSCFSVTISFLTNHLDNIVIVHTLMTLSAFKVFIWLLFISCCLLI